MKLKYLIACSASLGVMATMSPASAQDGQDLDSGEIIVTAQRESSLLSKTPIAMSAISGDDLRSSGVSDPTTLADTVPNISIDRNNGLQITIRGVSSSDNTEKGDPSAAFMLDGIYIARPQAQEVSFFDLERVEVLRGPQGTLFGRNTTAGLINVISKQPRLGEFSGSVDLGYGNFDAVQGTAALNIPMGENVAIRAAVNLDRRDNYLNPGSSAFSLDRYKDAISGRLSALFQISDRAALTLRGDYSEQKGTLSGSVVSHNFYELPYVVPADGVEGVSPTYLPVARSLQNVIGYNEVKRTKRDNSTWGIQGDFKYEISDSLSLNYLGSYREFTRNEDGGGNFGSVFHPTAGVVGGFVVPTFFGGKYSQVSQELRLAYSGDRLKLQAGAYYFREKSDISFIISDIPGPAPILGFLQQPTISKSVALFGQGTFDLTDSLRFTAGARYTRDNKSRRGTTIHHNTLADPIRLISAGGRDEINDASVKYNKLTWRAGLEFDANDRTLVFATVSTGYKAGGFNGGCLTGTPDCGTPRPSDELFYQPETLTSYEVGFKTRTDDGSLRLSGTAFHYDYSNLQVTQFVDLRQFTTNAGKAKVDGVELEATIKPSPRNKINIGVNWLNARYTDYAIFNAVAGPPALAEVNFRGKKLDRSPEWTVNAGYTYTLPIGDGDLALGVRTRISDEYKLLTTELRTQLRQPSYTKTDLTATYTAPEGRWYIQGFAKNLENKLTVSNFSASPEFGNPAGPPPLTFQGGTLNLGDPRTYGVRAGFKF